MEQEGCKFVWEDEEDSDIEHSCELTKGHTETHKCYCGEEYEDGD